VGWVSVSVDNMMKKKEPIWPGVEKRSDGRWYVKGTNERLENEAEIFADKEWVAEQRRKRAALPVADWPKLGEGA
jgi:hypothetical protein